MAWPWVSSKNAMPSLDRREVLLQQAVAQEVDVAVWATPAKRAGVPCFSRYVTLLVAEILLASAMFLNGYPVSRTSAQSAAEQVTGILDLSQVVQLPALPVVQLSPVQPLLGDKLLVKR